MILAKGAQRATFGPRRKPGDESVDMPAKPVDNDSVEVEREAPAEYNHSVEQVDDKKKSNSPAFEE